MKIAMLYRSRVWDADCAKMADHVFVRAEIIETHVEDVASGLEHIKPRKGEEFINCVEV